MPAKCLPHDTAGLLELPRGVKRDGRGNLLGRFHVLDDLSVKILVEVVSRETELEDRGVEVAGVVLSAGLEGDDRLGERVGVNDAGEVLGLLAGVGGGPVERVLDDRGRVFDAAGGEVLSAGGIDDAVRGAGELQPQAALEVEPVAEGELAGSRAVLVPQALGVAPPRGQARVLIEALVGAIEERAVDPRDDRELG